MTTSDNGLSLIREFEGCKLRTYADQRGIQTIGIGHRLEPGETYPNGITEAQALILLRSDVEWAERVINERVTCPLNQNQFDALVSFVFNIGSGNFLASSVFRALLDKWTAGVPPALLRWDRTAGSINDGLLRRRRAEAALFLKEPV